MEPFFYVYLLTLIILILTLTLNLLFFRHSKPSPDSPKANLPPGKSGLPIVGETFQYVASGRRGKPESFIFDRTTKYASNVFRTNLLREQIVVLCGAAAHKFLFSNENKLVQSWWPRSVDKIFPSSKQTSSKEEAMKMRKMLPNFFKPEALQRYVGMMDVIARKHFDSDWGKNDHIIVYPMTKKFTLCLAYRIFLSVDDPTEVERLLKQFNTVEQGLISLPLDLPGTSFRQAINAAEMIRQELLEKIEQRKIDLAAEKASPVQDILSHMLLTADEDGRFMKETYIADRILGLLIGGHDTSSSACTMIVKYLAELPEVYNAVYAEQMEIAKSKSEGENLNWNDIQKMKYSWNVACEVLRLAPPVQGAFREILVDFMYEGFSIPKGWKIYWSAHSTHKNPEYFSNPYEFDPTRFEDSGPAPYTFVPFGGGPRMCPGKEYARLEILVFMHNLVKKYKWEKLILDEKIIGNPMPVPEKGLPIRLFAHT